ncbi:hypothetical protein GIB67_032111 [Kingdonia uniflora]|uniref:Uncharacterized protein n=1 Tax=Kingdonia uniflora TaxID=39325 RepID=A0A7J7MX40_9MAGN|nr:hypothetical protein GIB67_032111 [Kingdonia uniflora]
MPITIIENPVIKVSCTFVMQQIWVEAESLRHLSAKYCPLVPPPRSTIAAAFSLDGKSLASTHGGLDHEVRLWDANTAECIGSRDFYRPIASIAFHAQGEVLAVASGHNVNILRLKILTYISYFYLIDGLFNLHIYIFRFLAASNCLLYINSRFVIIFIIFLFYGLFFCTSFYKESHSARAPIKHSSSSQVVIFGSPICVCCECCNQWPLMTC